MIAHGMAKKMGYDTVPWFALTQILLGIYVVMTILSMFFRPDFFNVSIDYLFQAESIIVDYLHNWDIYGDRHLEN